jgi:hypothetical protein
MSQGCIKLHLLISRSADFQSAVSQVSNLQALHNPGDLGVSAPCRLEVGDTADWKSALQGVANRA